VRSVALQVSATQTAGTPGNMVYVEVSLHPEHTQRNSRHPCTKAETFYGRKKNLLSGANRTPLYQRFK